MKYYGFSDLNAYSNNMLLTSTVANNSLIYPMPLLKNSRTLTKQASLPRLPVPALDASIQRYLNAVKPLVDDDEFESTRKIATDFVKTNGIGERLQKLLVEKSKTTDNWVQILNERATQFNSLLTF